MFANERLNQIIEKIRKQGAVITSELASEFGVSIETIRKDLLLLEKNNNLQRVHGGAILNTSVKPCKAYLSRIEENVDKKHELSVNAMSVIDEGDIIFIDCGSTAVEFVEVLKQNFHNLTIVTHSMDVFEILCRYENFKVILCGGHFIEEENAFCGPFVSMMLDSVHVQKVFIFPYAISIKNGISDYNRDLSEIQKKLVGVGDEVYVLADSSKFEKYALIKVCDMDTRYTYITDSGLPDEVRHLYVENNFRVITGKGVNK